ncbi:MAG: hypothetical protein AAB696_00075 [Patescibacteria group bacterium]
MTVFDLDGIIVESGRREKLWRWLARKIRIKTPRILFFLQEIIEVIFDIRPKIIKETAEAIKKFNESGHFVGLLTDRSLWSLWIFFSNNNVLSVKNFNFIQTRKSVLNRLLKKNPAFVHFLSAKKFANFEFDGVKSDIQAFQNLKKFAAENNIKELQEIFMIDDMPQILKLAEKNGFSIPF